MAEHYPSEKSDKQVFEELTQYAMGEELQVRTFGEGAEKIRDSIVNRVKKHFREKVGTLLKPGIESNGPEYLPVEHEDYLYVYDYVRKFVGNPATDEELDDLLANYANQLKTNPGRENFAERLPAMVYGQRPRYTEGTKESIFSCPGCGGEKRLVIGVRPIQAATLRTYLRPRGEVA